jgi:DNA-binding beta-propeller fold protein YncE
MSAGFLDEKVRLFGYTGDASNVNGFPASTYPFLEERWGRVESPSGDEVTVAAQASQRRRAVLTIDDDSRPVDQQAKADGVFKRLADGSVWKIVDVQQRRALRTLEIFGEWADENTFALTGEPA